MTEISKETLNRLKKLRMEQAKTDDEIGYCISQISLITERVATAHSRRDYPMILAMTNELANQNVKLQVTTQNKVTVDADLQQIMTNHPDILKREREMRLQGDYELRRAARKTPAANRTRKPAPKKQGAPKRR
ncbi:MAG: hypothetical protein PHR28_09300 [candidate division Zixibacteria bacterium]|jgi:hypothetical protein|nr:hypothetical protein [candidate division Zixibacteria bacterium]